MAIVLASKMRCGLALAMMMALVHVRAGREKLVQSLVEAPGTNEDRFRFRVAGAQRHWGSGPFLFLS